LAIFLNFITILPIGTTYTFVMQLILFWSLIVLIFVLSKIYDFHLNIFLPVKTTGI